MRIGIRMLVARRAASGALIAMVGGMAACSSDGGGDATSTSTPPQVDSPYSLKLYASAGGTRTRVDVVPVAAGATAGGGSLKTDSLATPSTVGQGLTLMGPSSVNDLLNAAAAECGMVGIAPAQKPAVIDNDGRYRDLSRMYANNQSIVSKKAPSLPWGGSSVFIFDTPPATCDQLLEYEETLLCVGDKLAQLADSITPITWQNVRWLQSGGPNAGDYNWTIPPQGEQDKFIARDLAIHVLGHVAWLDGYPVTPAATNWPKDSAGANVVSCSSLYSIYDAQPAATKAAMDAKLWSTAPSYPPDPVAGSSSGTRARARLAFETNTLRATGLLLHDVVRQSVYSDLAGAEHRRGDAQDPKAGGLAAWGATTGDPYNSLAHVARVLSGRWDSLPNYKWLNAGTACPQINPLGVLGLAQPGLTARAADVGTAHDDEALAATMFETAGIVVPAGSSVDLRAALQTQLLGVKAQSHAMTPAAFAATLGGVTLQSVIAQLPDAALSRGAERVRANFAAATNGLPADITQIDKGLARAGFTVSTVANASLAGGARAVQGGLSRSFSAGGDALTQVALIGVGSECYSDANSWTFDPNSLHEGAYMNPSWMSQVALNFTMQDAFTIGYALRTRLVKLREAADATTVGRLPPDARARANAVAELGNWAGATELLLSTDSNTAPTKLYLDMYGVTPQDYGVTRPEDMGTAISLVVGDGNDAECVTNLRAGCGPSSTATRWKASATAVVSPGDAKRRLTYGHTGAAVRLTFNLDATAPPGLQSPAAAKTGLGTGHPIFVVSSASTTRPIGQGAVLGVLKVDVTADATPFFMANAAVVSPMRNELARAAFGVGKWIGAAPPRIGDGSLSVSAQYCVEGISRDVFVPLENDLTSDSDGFENSWKHYLDVAQAAARRADDIGQTWVNIGLQRDQNSEAFEPDLIKNTGGPVDLDNVTVDANGNLQAGATNGALATILNAVTIDLVFLTEDPLKGDPKNLKDVLPCPIPAPAQPHPLCAKFFDASGNLLPNAPKLVRVDEGTIANFKGVSDGSSVSYAALGIAPAEKQPPPPSMDLCAPIVDLAAQSKGLAGPFSGAPGRFTAVALRGALSNGGWASDMPGINSQLHHMRMSVDATGDWTVKVAGALVMSTTLDMAALPTSAPLWPACLDAAQGKPCNFADPVTKTWNTLFRRCDASALQSALGACEGNDPLAERNLLRWRIEAAMWLAATMSGGVPEGMFDVPMPAVTFSAFDTDQTCAPVSHVFVNGNFNPDGTLSGSGPTTPGEWPLLADNTGLRPPAPISPGFHQWGSRAAEEVPWETRLAYIGGPATNDCRTKNSYVAHVFGSNASGPSDFTNLADFFAQRLHYGGLDKRALDMTALHAIGAALDGTQCASPVGNFPGGPSGLSAGWFQGLVAALKTQQSKSSDMRGAYYSDNTADAWFPWHTLFVWDSGAGAFTQATLAGDNGDDARVPANWFDATLTRYHWYNRPFIGSYTPYSTGTWSPLARDDQSWWGRAAWQRDDRLPSHIPLKKRVRAAVNSGAPNGDCGAEWQFTQSLALACVAARGISDSLSWPEPPKNIGSIEDLIQVEGWYRSTTKMARQMLGRLYVEKVPSVVVKNQMTNRVSAGGAEGDFGKQVYEIGKGMVDIVKQWNDVVERTAEITNAIQSVRVSVDQMNTENEKTLKELSIQELNVGKDMLEQAAKSVAAWASPGKQFGAAAITAAAVGETIIDGVIMSDLEDIKELEQRKHADQLKLAFLGLQNTLTKNSTDIQNFLIQITQDIADVRAAELGLQATRNAVAYDVGKAAGAGVWNCGSTDAPRECVSHVNTVLNRQYAGYERRYKSALRDAKALAFIARRAIEQRIGLRLDQITTRVGPLDAPSIWADDVCRLTGVDYRRLRTEPGLDAGAADRAAVNASEAAEFADAFIGDYVEKLANFVNYYNIVYPAHDGDDTAVLSLRNDVLREPGSCRQNALNLLRNSGHLNFTVQDGATVTGWQRHTCAATDALCVSALSTGPSILPAEAPNGGSAWLLMKALPSQGGALDAYNSGAIGGPRGMVSQAVTLDPGHYVLTWWDRALDVNGAPTTAPLGAYGVAVFSADWNTVNGFSDLPAKATTPSTWSGRRVIEFDANARAVFHVAFAPSVSPGSPGSVAIANVQLERAPSSAVAASYQDTDSEGLATSFACAASASTLRSAFRRNCDPTGACFWELKVPLDFDTRAMTINGYPLRGKVADGNFNFRHIDVAVNLVGTGVRDCSGASGNDCFGSGYIEYSLDHDGDDVGILGYDGQVRVFDFGIGSIAHGKALAAERYITMPLGSADQSLLQQPGILKPELRGRPLDGSYALRVYDSPALRWEKIDDVQIVLKYRYWSRIATPGQF